MQKLSKSTAHVSCTVVKSKKAKLVTTSESSEDESKIPDLKVIRSSKLIQKKCYI